MTIPSLRLQSFGSWVFAIPESQWFTSNETHSEDFPRLQDRLVFFPTKVNANTRARPGTVNVPFHVYSSNLKCSYCNIYYLCGSNISHLQGRASMQ